MDVRLPDGTIIKGVPDDITKADLVQRLKTNGYDTSALESQQTPAPVEAQKTEPSRRLQNFSPMGVFAREVMKKFDAENAREFGGAVTDVASSLGASPEVAGGAGYAANVGIQSVPVLLGGMGGSKATAGLGDKTGAMLMQSALKPPKAALESGKADKAIKTLLGEGVNVTPGGVEKLQRLIDGLNLRIKAQIANSPAEIDKNKVVQGAQAAIDKFKMQVNPNSDLAAIQRGIDEFVAHPVIAGMGKDIPVQIAQSMKQATYKSLGAKAYGELKGAEIEIQKQLARGLREEISRVVPGIDKLNAREADLLNAHALTLSRVLMDSNKNPAGLGWLIVHPSNWVGWAADRSPLIKSLMARAAHKGVGVGAAVGGTAGAVAPHVAADIAEQISP